MSPPPPWNSTPVVIVEDDEGIRSAWMKILNRFPEFPCVGDFGSGEEALEGLAGCSPAFVLMDIHLPGMTGIECTREIKRRFPAVEVIMLTMFGDRDRIFEALQAGASGYLLKRTTPALLKAALEEARAGGAPMSPQIARQVVQFFQNVPPAKAAASSRAGEKLSPREDEIVRFLAAGLQYKEIADRTESSIDTVRTHIRRIYHKLHVHSRTEAVIKYLSPDGR